MSYSGYLTKRSSPISPPPMQKMYCVLWGTLLMDFDCEEDAKNSMNPKVTTEILGISEWDGKGRANSYPFGFLLVTHTGGTYYVTVPTIKDRDEWIIHVKRALECIFANPEVVPFKPSKIIQNRPQLSTNMICPRSHHTLSSSSVLYCKSCGRGYYSSEFVSEYSTMLQIGCEDAEKVCLDCKNAQAIVLWIKSLNYVHVMTLHEMSSNVLTDVNKFKNSFKLRRRLSSRLEMAASLLTQGNISVEEFEELRSVDHAYRRELVYEESQRIKSAVEAFGEDMQTILGILMNPHLTDQGGRASYYCIILRILEIADRSPDLIDFYFPQLVQVHLQETRVRTMESLIKVDLLQQALLVISQKYPALGLKLAWSLLASGNDYAEKRITMAQYAACTCLLLQLEIAVTGVVSSIADKPTCRQLARVFRGAAHQQQEMGFEISALFLVRRRLQEVYDEEEASRQSRTRRLYSTTEGDCFSQDGEGDDVVIITSSKSCDFASSEPSSAESEAGNPSKKRPHKVSDSSGHVASSADRHQRTLSTSQSRPRHETTCLELLYQLGVGQAGRDSTNSFHYISEADSDDDEEEGDSSGGEDNTKSGEIAMKVKVEKVAKRPSEILEHSNNSYTTHQWSGFAEQLDFIDRLNDVVESLRFIDRPLRTETLVKELSKWNESPFKYLGWDPTTIAGEPHYRITRVISEECRVFRTKARAPTLLVCEVVRDDLASQGHYANNSGLHRTNSSRFDLSDSPDEDEEDHDDSGFCIAEPDNQKIETPRDRNRSHSSSGYSQNDPPNTPGSLRHSFGTNQDSHYLQATNPHKQALVEASMSQIEELVGSSMTETIAVLHKQHSNLSGIAGDSVKLTGPPAHSSSFNVGSSSGAPVVSNSAMTISTTTSGSVKKLASQLSNTALSDMANSPNGSVSRDSTKSARSTSAAIPVVMHRRKSSTFLSSNRLAVNAEDMMRSTLSSSPSNSTNTIGVALKLSAAALHSSNSLSDLQGSSGGSPLMRMSTSGKFKTSSGVALSDDDTASQHNGSDDISQSAQSDSGSVRSSGGGPENALVTHKVLSSAQRLLQSGKIDVREYEQLIASDMQYHEESAREEAQIARCRVEIAFGESWQTKKERIVGDKLFMHHDHQHGALDSLPPTAESAMRGDTTVGFDHDGMTADASTWPAWDLRCFIVKSNDDLRQEVCCLQLMQLCKEVFEHFGLANALWLKPYRIVSTGNSTGIVHVLTDATSLDALKKTPGFTNLNNYFKKTYDSSPERLSQAKRNFTASLAAYSLFSYILLIKDRHNGNLMIDAEGHIIHIDFGFLLSIAPGGSFSVESAPFKLTEEMVEVMGGLDSPLFGEFVNAFTKGFIALQANAENIVGALQILSLNSTFPCFAGKQVSGIIDKLRGRFRTELSVGDAVKHCLDLITNSYGNYGTRQYDTFQYLTNGIFP